MPEPIPATAQTVAGIRQPETTWLSEGLGTRITGLESRVIGSSRGFVSTTWRLRLEADPPGSAPPSLVLKSESSNPQFQAIAREQRCFEREISLYRQLAASMQEHIPHVLAMGHAGDRWLLMEDLSHLRAGDQVRGMSQEESRAVVRRIAAIHARFWMDSRLLEQDWLPSHNFWFQKPQPSAWEPFLRDYGLRLGDSLNQLVQAVLAQETEIDAALAQRPWSLVHGDLRADNLLFGGVLNNPSATIVDWAAATRSLAAIDLAFLLGGSEPIAERSGHLNELFYLWHGELLAHGVRDYPLHEAHRDLQLAALRCMTTAIKLYELLDGPGISNRAALFFDQAIERHCNMLLELSAWEALPQPIAG